MGVYRGGLGLGEAFFTGTARLEGCDCERVYAVARAEEGGVGMSEGADITVIEVSGNDETGYLEGAHRRVDGELEVSSVEDMVNKVLAEIGDEGCIRTLDLVGHGSAGNISVGDGDGRERGKHINGRSADWEPHLERLVGRFCEGGKLRLLGCNTGVCARGAAKLARLSRLLKVSVCGTRRVIHSREFGSNGYEGEEDFVEVPADSQDPGCQTALFLEGLGESQRVALADLAQPALVTAFGVRDVLRLGHHRHAQPQLLPFQEPHYLKGLLDCLDGERAFDGDSLAADVDAVIQLAYGSSRLDHWSVILDRHALIIHRAKGRYLFTVKDADGFSGYLDELLKTQTAFEALERTQFDRRFPVIPAPLATDQLPKALRQELVPEFRDLDPRAVLKAPLWAFRVVSKEAAAHLAEAAGQRTIGDLLEGGPDTRLSALAREIRAASSHEE